MGKAYYNEIDKFAANWLRNLIGAGLIAPGEVDERSISDVRPSDLTGYTQCHFFAGIGGWSYALRLAGWPDDRPVWTGSCPCQPFSIAGTHGGTTDERHLWPHWFHLIRAFRPQVLFGEQVEAAIGHGWLDLVQDDLEGEGYEFAPVVLPAACVGAPHIRHRLWFVGHDSRSRLETRQGDRVRVVPRTEQGSATRSSESLPSWLAYDPTTGLQGSSRGDIQYVLSPENSGVDNNNNKGLEGREQRRNGPDQRSPWAPGLVDWLYCTDGKWRPVESGTFPLADGVPNRVGLLRGYGNAIVPQVAAEVIRAYMECRP